MSGKREPLRLGSLVEETLPIVVERANPKYRKPGDQETVEVILEGLVYGGRCPALVKIKLASISDTYKKATTGPLGEDGQPTFQENDVAWRTYLRGCLRALVRGMTEEEADLLAGDETRAISVLRYLRYWKNPEEADDPEAEGEAPSETGAESSPNS